MRLFSAITILTLTSAALAASPQTPATPVPQPFPGAGSPGPSGASRPPQATTPPPQTAPVQPVAAPAAPAAAPASSVAQPVSGVPVYPTAEYVGTYDAGAGQQYVLYGVQLPFAEVVTYYKAALKSGGREIFRAPMPPTHQFDLGRYNEDRMAFPPSVVVKDYTWNNSPGYLHVVGTTEKRYRTIIQIVAPGPTP